MHPPTLPSPSLLPYLSSVEAGWDGLLAQAYRQVPEMEGHILPGETDIELALFTGGTMRMEAREVHAHQSWDGATLRNGDFILHAGTNLSYELRWRCLSPIPTYSFRLHLSRGLLARTVEDLTGGHALQLELAEQKGFQDPFLMQMALRLWRELEERAPSGKLFAHCAAQVLLLHLLRYYAGSGNVAAAIPELPHTLTPQQLQRVSTYIRGHAGQELTLEVLAQQIGYSPYHFARLFRKTTGETPHQYVRRERLAHARCLLESTRLPLAEVAAESGFGDQSYFTRVFREALHMTPAAYRRELTS
jgi:AraC family transcriptional regulator